MNIVTIDVIDGGMLRRRFEADIDSLQHLQRGTSPRSRLVAGMEVAALHLGNGLDDAQRIVLGQDALLDQVMDQALEQHLGDGLADICACRVSELKIGATWALS